MVETIVRLLKYIYSEKNKDLETIISVNRGIIHKSNKNLQFFISPVAVFSGLKAFEMMLFPD